MTTNHAQMHLGRRDMAREIAQKLTGQQADAEAELRRCEGAMGVLAQMQEAMSKQRAAFEANPPPYPDNSTDEQITTRLDVKIAVEDCFDEVDGGYRNLKTAAELNMVALRGRIAMVESALDLCEAAFEQESGALKEVLAVVQAELDTPEVAKGGAKPGPRKVGKRPAPPIARTRKAGGVKK